MVQIRADRWWGNAQVRRQQLRQRLESAHYFAVPRMDKYPITEACDKLGALARQVSAEQKHVALTGRGQTMAVLISPAELEELEYHRGTAEYLAREDRGETGPGVPRDEARRRIFGDAS